MILLSFINHRLHDFKSVSLSLFFMSPAKLTSDVFWQSASNFIPSQISFLFFFLQTRGSANEGREITTPSQKTKQKKIVRHPKRSRTIRGCKNVCRFQDFYTNVHMQTVDMPETNKMSTFPKKLTTVFKMFEIYWNRAFN